MGNGGRIANILLPRGSVFLAAPCAFLCGIVHGIRPRVFPPIKANLRYHFCYHYFKSHPPFSDQVCRILEKVTLDLADSRATGFSEDATKTVFRFRLQHVALCCIGVTPGGGRVQESKNGRAKLDANLAGAPSPAVVGYFDDFDPFPSWADP